MKTSLSFSFFHLSLIVAASSCCWWQQVDAKSSLLSSSLSSSSSISSSSTTKSHPTSDTHTHRSLQAQYVNGQYDPWELGTPVYAEFPEEGGWFWGVISDFDTSSGIYTIAWSDGTFEDFTAAEYDDIDQMVSDADTPWDIGTIVYKEFDDGWYEGTVTGYDKSGGEHSNKPYTVTWVDGTTHRYNEDHITQFVNNAEGIPETQKTPDYNLGIQVYRQFDDGWWYWGVITGYEYGIYTVTWSDGGVETYGSELVDEMVQDAIDANTYMNDGDISPDTMKDTFAIGTVVSEFFQDGWYEGTITDFDGTTYTVTWTDGEIDTYTKSDIPQMVADAITNYGSGTNSQTNTPLYELGTQVYKEFPDDGGWYWGVISGFSYGIYTVTWSDEGVETYNGPAIAIMIQDAEDYKNNVSTPAGDITASPPSSTDGDGDGGTMTGHFLLGTQVYEELDGKGWFVGVITAYDNSNGQYTVKWSDGTIDPFVESDIEIMAIQNEVKYQQAMDQLASEGLPPPNTNDYGQDDDEDDDGDIDGWSTAPIYPFATPVYMKFGNGQWYRGAIIGYDETTQMYSVQWSVGDVEYFASEEIPDMASTYAESQYTKAHANDKDRIPAGALFVVVLLSVVVVLLIGYFCHKQIVTGKEKSFSIESDIEHLSSEVNRNGRSPYSDNDPYMDIHPSSSYGRNHGTGTHLTPDII